ncbi:unnamed protein product [Timema podura]|uniref:HPS5-like beta-propeller domain-containing protein n=1 Tax=Timema podura TaxID=61482 RepID=A0ABN7NLU1_TIMPD|nr:unnamed protein product [Timema podura]
MQQSRQDGAITRLSISPNEKMFVVATLKGVVCVLERNEGRGARRVLVSNEHQGSEVTALQWNSSSSEIFIADDVGRVSVLTVSLFTTKTMFQTPSFQLMQLDSRVVQLDWYSDLLLVSTLSRSYLCDTVREQYRQLGQKLREGEYGACFFSTVDQPLPSLASGQRSGSFRSIDDAQESRNSYEGLKNVKMFCARPGSRVWEVNLNGTVVRTHQFKEALAIPPTRVINLLTSVESNPDKNAATTSCTDISEITWGHQSFNFSKLFIISKKLLFTFKKDGIYVFDPENANVVLWSDAVKDIVDVKVLKDTLYIWTESSKLRAFTLSSIEKFLVKLYFQKHYLVCSEICFDHQEFLLKHISTFSKLFLLSDLDSKLNDIESIQKISSLLQELKRHATERPKQLATKLKSGIFLVGNSHAYEEEENSLRSKNKGFSKEGVKLKQSKEKIRSSSVSPKVPRRRKPPLDTSSLRTSEKSGSTTSLPDSLDKSIKSLVVSEANPTNAGKTTLTGDVPFQPMTPPEAIQALKEIGQSVSGKLVTGTRVLKEKWQMFEGKMKLLHKEATVEVLDVKPQDYIEDQTSLTEEDELNGGKSDIVYDKKKDVPVSKCPPLNVTRVVELCQAVKSSAVNDFKTIALELLHNLWIAINNYYKFSTPLDISGTQKNEISQVESCSRLKKDINLQDVSYLVLKLEQCWVDEGESKCVARQRSNSLFLSYVDKLSDRVEAVVSSLKSSKLGVFMVEAYKELNQEPECSCHCGYPGPQPPEPQFTEIGALIFEHLLAQGGSEVQTFLHKVPGMWRHFLRLKSTEPIDSVLPLIVHLGEVSALEERLSEMSLFWGQAFDYIVKYNSGLCLNCGQTVPWASGSIGITWSSIGALAVKGLGPQETLKLLLKYSDKIKPGELDARFYQSCIFSAIIDNNATGLRDKVVDLVHGKLDNASSSTALISTKVAPMLQEALLADLEKAPQLVSHHQDHHWGARVEFKTGVCPCCALPLDTTVLLHDGGLTVFRCGHAYHTVCIRHRQPSLLCLVCEKLGIKQRELAVA